jgi:predicted metallopeptidase
MIFRMKLVKSKLIVISLDLDYMVLKQYKLMRSIKIKQKVSCKVWCYNKPKKVKLIMFLIILREQMTFLEDIGTKYGGIILKIEP